MTIIEDDEATTLGIHTADAEAEGRVTATA